MSDKIEKLISNYPQMVKERTFLENQIKLSKGITEDEMIETLNFNHSDGERVQSSDISDKTAKIALTYKDKMETINHEWIEHLKRKHSLLSEEIIFFESAVKSLSSFLPEFITDMVIGRMTWDSLAVKYHVSRTMVAKYRKKAIREFETLYNIRDKEISEYILS